ncbi:MAG: class I SAM-dependent methyltransferase [Clostridia bacterium]|nr:class I SAM-dependent methyltransferase [Clostridia bacterium]
MASPFTPFNALGLTHEVMSRHIPTGGFCVDATAGRGRDALFLCRLVGPTGRVLAMDIQPEAVAQTRALLRQEGCSWGQVVQDCHSRMEEYAQAGTVDGIMFNFGWLPGGDHDVFSCPDTSIRAVEAGLKLLRSGGLMSLCVYYGRNNGTAERDALLEWLPTLDDKQFTVIRAEFSNRKGDVPFPVFIYKE